MIVKDNNGNLFNMEDVVKHERDPAELRLALKAMIDYVGRKDEELCKIQDRCVELYDSDYKTADAIAYSIALVRARE